MISVDDTAGLRIHPTPQADPLATNKNIVGVSGCGTEGGGTRQNQVPPPFGRDWLFPMVCLEQLYVMLWPWQTLKAMLQKMQRVSEFIAFHGTTLAGYTVCGFRSSSTKFTVVGRTLAGRAQGIQHQLRPPLFLN